MGGVPKPRRAPVLSDLTNIRWEPGLSNGDISWGLNRGSDFRLISDRAHDNYALYTNTDGTGFEDAKAMNEHYRGSQIDINFNEVETPTEIIESGVVKAPWIDVPYLETAVTLKFSGSGDTYHTGFGIHPGWSETEFTPTRALSSSELKVVRDSLYAYSSDLTIRATVTVSDLDGSNAHSFTMENASFDAWANLGSNSSYLDLVKPYERSGKQFKVKLEGISTVVRWWNGKIDVNFEPKELTATPNQ